MEEVETKFLDGEKILCFHGPLIYEAKIQKVEVKDGQTKYFIHYMGWNKNWDEWVTFKFLLPATNDSLSTFNFESPKREATTPSTCTSPHFKHFLVGYFLENYLEV